MILIGPYRCSNEICGGWLAAMCSRVTFEGKPRLLGFKTRLFRCLSEAFVFVQRRCAPRRVKLRDGSGEVLRRRLILVQQSVLVLTGDLGILANVLLRRHLMDLPRHLLLPSGRCFAGDYIADVVIRAFPLIRDPTRALALCSLLPERISTLPGLAGPPRRGWREEAGRGVHPDWRHGTGYP